MIRSAPSVAPDEIHRFSAASDAWWRADGAFRGLHELMPARLAYVERQIAVYLKRPLKNLRVLDVGCGGGLMAEPLARAGAKVVGIDASPQAIEAARRHAQNQKLEIDYRVATAEALAQEGETFDLVLALEIFEHVADRESLLGAMAECVRPKGLLVAATLNRTKRSFLLAVVMAEYVLGWVPVGAHDWNKFVTPAELVALMKAHGLMPTDCAGVVFNPLTRQFTLAKGRTAVNYFMTARKS